MNSSKHSHNKNDPGGYCDLCGKFFTRKDHIKRHMQTVHKIPPSGAASKPAPSPAAPGPSSTTAQPPHDRPFVLVDPTVFLQSAYSAPRPAPPAPSRKRPGEHQQQPQQPVFAPYGQSPVLYGAMPVKEANEFANRSMYSQPQVPAPAPPKKKKKAAKEQSERSHEHGDPWCRMCNKFYSRKDHLKRHLKNVHGLSDEEAGELSNPPYGGVGLAGCPIPAVSSSEFSSS